MQRRWSRDAPDVVWVSDFAYGPTREGWVYTSFLQRAYSRFIVGYTISSSMSTKLVLRSLEQALSVRQRTDPTFTAEGVICHANHGSQGQSTSLAFSQQLIEHGINASMGRIGTAYDCQTVAVESFSGSEVLVGGLYKAELVHAKQLAWISRQEVETATAAWVQWFNQQRLHSAIEYHSPASFEAAYHETLGLPRQAA